MMISVCLASYNGEKYIEEQIDSILSQLGENDELVISDDGSKDRTLEIIRGYNDPRIRLLIHNKGCYTKNFENAISHAKGDYIFLSDQDDIWLPDKVQVTMEAFQKTGADFLVSAATLVDGQKKILIEDSFAGGAPKTGFWNNLIATSYIGACMVFRKEVLERVLPIPGKDKYIAHDYWIACICERYYKTALIDQPLILYRRHGDNTSPAFGKSRLTVPERIYKRFYTLYFILGRKKCNCGWVG